MANLLQKVVQHNLLDSREIRANNSVPCGNQVSLLTLGQSSSVQLFSSMKSRSSVQLAGKTACTWVVFSNQ